MDGKERLSRRSTELKMLVARTCKIFRNSVHDRRSYGTAEPDFPVSAAFERSRSPACHAGVRVVRVKGSALKVRPSSDMSFDAPSPYMRRDSHDESRCMRCGSSSDNYCDSGHRQPGRERPPNGPWGSGSGVRGWGRSRPGCSPAPAVPAAKAAAHHLPRLARRLSAT